MNIQHMFIIIALAWIWSIVEGLDNSNQTVTNRNQLAEHDSDVLSKSELKSLQSSTHQPNLHSSQHVSVANLSQGIANQTVDITFAASEELSHNNVTMYERQMWQLWNLRRLEIQGQYAYISIVFLVCLTLAGLHCMGGLHGRHRRTVVMSVNDEMHFLTVKEVLLMKARYLPLLHRNDELKEVLVHDRGTDP
ncbi:hypothetical protein BsWGS_21857 [Bradybaena similaris]